MNCCALEWCMALVSPCLKRQRERERKTATAWVKYKQGSALRGLQFKTEELQRCCEGGEDGASEVTVTVATTATYGDRFRVVCRHRRAPLRSQVLPDTNLGHRSQIIIP